jgi:hypothetical protein
MKVGFFSAFISLPLITAKQGRLSLLEDFFDETKKSFAPLASVSAIIAPNRV